MDCEHVWVPDPEWLLVNGGKCRRKHCQQPAVAGLMRIHRYSRYWEKYGLILKREHLWRYCADHLYGRRIEGNQLLVQVHRDSPMAARNRR